MTSEAGAVIEVDEVIDVNEEQRPVDCSVEEETKKNSEEVEEKNQNLDLPTDDVMFVSDEIADLKMTQAAFAGVRRITTTVKNRKSAGPGIPPRRPPQLRGLAKNAPLFFSSRTATPGAVASFVRRFTGPMAEVESTPPGPGEEEAVSRRSNSPSAGDDDQIRSDEESPTSRNNPSERNDDNAGVSSGPDEEPPTTVEAIEAQPVDEMALIHQAEDHLIATAARAEVIDTKGLEKARKRRLACFVGVVLLCFVAITVGLGVGLSSDDQKAGAFGTVVNEEGFHLEATLDATDSSARHYVQASRYVSYGYESPQRVLARDLLNTYNTF